MKLVERIKRWYQGEYVVWKNDPNDSVIVIGGHQEYSTSAKIFRAIVQHLAKEWKWWIGTVIAVAGLALAWQRTRQSAPGQSDPALHAPSNAAPKP